MIKKQILEMIALLLFCNSCRCLNSDTNSIYFCSHDYMKMMKMCESYILNYQPLYVLEKDTLVVARFNKVPDSLNAFLIHCADIDDFRPLKYSFALVIKHNFEYFKINKSDYVIGDGLLIEQNGFIILIRKAMNIGNPYDSIDINNYFPFNTGEVCLWMQKNKESINDFRFIEKYRKYLRSHYYR